ncbi:MAG: hypothetical protein AB7L09_21515 [Nitrospira sp.]
MPAHKTYKLTRSYLAGMPKTIEAETEGQLERKLQELADSKRCRIDRPPIGLLSFDWSTDQLDARFLDHKGRVRIFATAVPS